MRYGTRHTIHALRIERVDEKVASLLASHRILACWGKKSFPIVFRVQGLPKRRACCTNIGVEIWERG